MDDVVDHRVLGSKTIQTCSKIVLRASSCVWLSWSRPNHFARKKENGEVFGGVLEILEYSSTRKQDFSKFVENVTIISLISEILIEFCKFPGV